MEVIPQLSEGCLKRLISADSGDSEWEAGHIVQILSLKKIATASAQSTAQDRYRLIISDGLHYTQAMLATQLNHMVEENQLLKYSIVKMERVTCNNTSIKRLLILLDLSVISHHHEKIGDSVGLDIPSHANGSANEAGASPAPAISAASTAINTPQPANSAVRTQPKGNQPVVFPIEGLSPYQNKWTIRARVSLKSDIRTYSNQKGEGKFVTVHFLDSSGEIRATLWNHAADMFYDRLQEGKVYYISKGRVQLAKKKFSPLTNEYELSLDEKAEIVECEDQENAPQVKYTFVPLSELEQLEKDRICDVIGIAREVSDVQEIITRAGRPLKKRELTLVDRSEYQVRLTLWGKQAEEYHEDEHAVVAAKGVKVGDFGGRSLSMVGTSSMVANPDITDAHILRGWFDSLRAIPNFKSQTTAPGGGGRNTEFKSEKAITLQEIREQQSNLGDQQQDHCCRAMIVHIKTDNISYPGCPSCFKKVIDTNEGWRCEKCDRSYEEPDHRYMLSMSVADYTGQLWFSGFNDAGLIVFGVPANELIQIKANDESAFNALVSKSLCKTYNFACRAKQDTYNEMTRFRYSINRIEVPDFKQEARQLIKHLKSDWAK